VGNQIKDVHTKEDCLAYPNHQWINSDYNFDHLGQALLTLFVIASKDGWVNIMYTGIDAVGVDKQPIVLNMFVGVVIENFQKCRARQAEEENSRRSARRENKIKKAIKRMFILAIK